MQADSAAEPVAEFEGISDFSDVVTNVVNTVGAVVRNRLESFINGGETYGVDEKIQKIINKVIALIPDQIDLGDSGLYLDGWLFKGLTAGHDELQIPLNVMIRYNETAFDSSKCYNSMKPKF